MGKQHGKGVTINAKGERLEGIWAEGKRVSPAPGTGEDKKSAHAAKAGISKAPTVKKSVKGIKH